MTWAEPEEPNGDLRYNITLRERELARDEDAMLLFTTEVSDSSVEINFMVTVLPYSVYSAGVTPFTGAGEGNTTLGSILTDEEGGMGLVFG